MPIDVQSEADLVDLEARASSKSTDADSLATRCLSDIKPMPVCWLWPGRIARGKLTIIAGNPGLGKSQITASIAAVVTQGGNWPVDRHHCAPGKVLFFSAEDDPADTLRPRLEAAGANLRRVYVVDGVTLGFTGEGVRKERGFSLREDVTTLGIKLRELGDVAAVIIDPITAYLGDTDSHKNAEVRGLLAPLSELAARHNTAVIGVSHLTKAVGSQALMRVTGSLAFVAAARAAYLVTVDSENKARRYFLPLKNNLGPDVAGLAFGIEAVSISSAIGPVQTSRVSWEPQAVSVTADEAMQAAESPQRNLSALDEAKEWLRETLAYGPMPATEVFARAADEGIATKTLQRASKVVVAKTKQGMDAGWMWSLPPKMVTRGEDAQDSHVTAFGKADHLRMEGEE
jgi:putative DNA primase/helicase